MAESPESRTHRPAEVFVEVRPPSDSGDLSPRITVPEEFRRRAGEVADSVAEIVSHFQARLGKIIESPIDTRIHVETIELGFELALRTEAGVVIAKAASDATFSARLTLKAPPQES